jgi:hypothetical protein
MLGFILFTIVVIIMRYAYLFISAKNMASKNMLDEFRSNND